MNRRTRSCERSFPVDAGGEDDTANGCVVVQARLSQGVVSTQAGRVRKNSKFEMTEGVRSRSTVSLSPAVPKAAPVTKVSLWPFERPDSFLPYWSSARRCLRMQKDVRGGTESSSRLFQPLKARRVGEQRGNSRARSEAGPLKLAQANSSATTRDWIRSARTASGPERSSPLL